MNKQLTLPITLQDDATFTNYFPGLNGDWVSYLQQFVSGHKERYAYLWGESGVGCSHLLQACCHDSLSLQHSAIYLSLSNRSLKPAILENLEQSYLVCLDDIDPVMGHAEWEEALFYLYNRIFEQGSLLIMSAKTMPQNLSIQLTDLASRLASNIVINLQALTDEEKLLALQLRANNWGLQLSDDVGQFLLRRFPRNMSALFEALLELDQASLAFKRKLTIPFVKEVLFI